MKVNVFQKGFNYSQDGPGNRLVFHLQGCNMHCPWCSNPEGICPSGSILSSGAAADKDCPHGAIVSGRPNIEICRLCNKPCLSAHSKEIRWSCTQHETKELVDEAISCSMMFFGGGGVTFTGGEATMQFEALQEMLKELKANGIDTAIETNGTHPNLPELFPYIDHLMIDFKHFDNEKLRNITGCSGETTLKNIFAAAYRGYDLIVRIPLINGFNCTKKDAAGLANALRPVVDRCRVEVICYHEYGMEKWRRCGMDYGVTNGNVSNEQLTDFINILRSNEIMIVRT